MKRKRSSSTPHEEDKSRSSSPRHDARETKTTPSSNLRLIDTSSRHPDNRGQGNSTQAIGHSTEAALQEKNHQFCSRVSDFVRKETLVDHSLDAVDSYYQNLYDKEELDFADLAQQDAEFGKFVRGKRHLEFSDPAATLQLTKTLLSLDFGLKIDLPSDRLCPPVPNRHNYILWLKKLLDSSTYNRNAKERVLHGLDIGTGASCIYPLLGCVQRPWNFTATEISPHSYNHACVNVATNHLQSRIHVLLRSESKSDKEHPRPLESSKITVFPTEDEVRKNGKTSITNIDFTMCNPPFYSSAQDMENSLASKNMPPKSICMGAPVEMIYSDNGEVGFVRRMIAESKQSPWRDNVQWFTTMLGKRLSLGILVTDLLNLIEEEKKATGGRRSLQYAVTEFIQGKKTRRWGLAWSFQGMRASDEAARNLSTTTNHHQQRGVSKENDDLVKKEYNLSKVTLPCKARQEIRFSVAKVVSLQDVTETITSIMSSLELCSWRWDDYSHSGVGRAYQNVWSRTYRRRKKRGEQTVMQNDAEQSLEATPTIRDSIPVATLSPNGSVLFGFQIDCVSSENEFQRNTGARPLPTQVFCRWREGFDESIFLSFCGHLTTQLSKAFGDI